MNELQDRITYPEFEEWLEFISREENRRTKQDYYLAQIAYYTAVANAAEPKKVKFETFLMDFEKTGKAAEMTPKERMMRSKAAWCSYLGLSLTKPSGKN